MKDIPVPRINVIKAYKSNLSITERIFRGKKQFVVFSTFDVKVLPNGMSGGQRFENAVF